MVRANWKSNFDAEASAGGPADGGCPRRHDDVVQETGRYRVGMTPGSVADTGSYAVTWKLVDGRWLIDRNVIISAKQ